MEYACLMGENIACFNVQRYPELKSSSLLISFIYYYLPVRAKNGIALLPWDNSPQRQLVPRQLAYIKLAPRQLTPHLEDNSPHFDRQLAPL